MEILHLHFAGAATTAGVHRAGLGLPPGPGFQIDLALVLGILAFAFNSVEF